MTDATNITSTGIRGFLEWLDQQQPGLSSKVKAQLPNAVPEAFSNYHAGGYLTAGKSLGEMRRISARRVLGSLGQSTDTSLISLSDPTLQTVDVGSELAPITPAQVDTTQAANDGSASTGTTGTIANIVQGISALYLTKQQADIQQQVVNTQLQRAAAGLPPLPTSLSNLGVPQVSVGLSSGTGTALAIGAAVVLGLLIFSGGRRRA